MVSRVYDPARLRTFLAVAAEGSVGRAAANLGYTPSAVSQQLTVLQRETGLTLVERVGRGIEVTAIGRIFAAEAGRTLAALAALERTADDLRGGRTGSLTIAYFSSAGTAWMPPVVARLRAEFPQLRLNLHLIELGGVENPDIALAIDEIAGPEASDPGPPAYRSEFVTQERYRVVVPDGHRLAGAESVSLAELAAETWIDNDVLEGPCSRIVHGACRAHGFEPPYGVQAQDHPTAMSFVAAGVGVTVLPDLASTALPAGTTAVRITDPALRRTIRLRIREAVAGNPAAIRFAELLREQVAAG